MRPRSVEANPCRVADFDVMDELSAEAIVRPSCASERWIAYVVRKRPYELLTNVLAASDDAIRVMDWPDVEQAIGPLTVSDRAPGRALTGRPAAADDTAAGAPPPLPAALVAAMADYQNQFGHGLLITTPGRAATDLLDQVRLRLAHDAEVERRIVRADLRKIVRLRLSATFQASQDA